MGSRAEHFRREFRGERRGCQSPAAAGDWLRRRVGSALSRFAAVEKRLRNGCHIFRYTAPDDFGAPTVAFTVCTLWYVNALAAVGRREEAREIFEHVLSCRNHLGLLSEDVNPKTGELWGNFPQTYSMVGLIISAMQLSRTWE